MLGIDTFYMTSYKSERQRKIIQNDMYNTSTNRMFGLCYIPLQVQNN